MNKFSEILKYLRKTRMQSQQTLADELNFKRYKISNLEQGRVEPSLDDLILIAKYFDVTTDYLLGLEK